MEPSKEFTEIKEGSATIRVPGTNVFYNKVQVMNRDISILALQTFSQQWNPRKPVRQGLRAIEALAATGLRSIRYAKECPGIFHTLIVNDLVQSAVDTIKDNIIFNEIDPAIVIPNRGDACEVLMQNVNGMDNFDFIDLDPFGTSAPFIDPALRSISNGGMIAITCTDMRNLAGVETAACFSLYGAMPLRGVIVPEMALRILLGTLERAASRLKKSIEPVLSLYMGYYVRCFVRVRKSPAEAQKSSLLLSNVYKCNACQSFWHKPLGEISPRGKLRASHAPALSQCKVCQSDLFIGGPIYNASMHNADFINGMLLNLKKEPNHLTHINNIRGLLENCMDEIDTPFFYSPSSMSSQIHISAPPILPLKSALENLGYKTSNTHAEGGFIKTNATAEIVWDVLKCWNELHPNENPRRQAKDPLSQKILSIPPSIKADFDTSEELLARQSSKRFYPNPEENWGPKKKPTG